jgi:hypothetical protein
MESFSAAERDVLKQVLGEFLADYASIDSTFWSADGRRRFGLAQSALDEAERPWAAHRGRRLVNGRSTP